MTASGFFCFISQSDLSILVSLLCLIDQSAARFPKKSIVCWPIRLRGLNDIVLRANCLSLFFDFGLFYSFVLEPIKMAFIWPLLASFWFGFHRLVFRPAEGRGSIINFVDLLHSNLTFYYLQFSDTFYST